MPPSTPRREVFPPLLAGVCDVLNAAIDVEGYTDLRQGILTAVYNYDTESFEIRWDLAK